MKNDIGVSDLLSEEKRVAQLLLSKFEEYGLHLEGDQRKSVITLKRNIQQLGNIFTVNCSRPAVVEKPDVNKDFKKFMKLKSNKSYLYSLHSENASEFVREYAYKTYMKRTDDMEAELYELLAARHQLALLHGFPTYAHKALNGSFAQTPDVVQEFLVQLSDELYPKAERDHKDMTAMKVNGDFKNEQLCLWDLPYYTSLAKKHLSPEQMAVNQYFPLGSCMEGVKMLFENLFAVHLVPVTPHIGEVWCPTVRKIKVIKSNNTLGHIYCDFEDRISKSFTDHHHMLQCSRHSASKLTQTTEVVLLFNFPDPLRDMPVCLSFQMVETLFREMGRALHTILSGTSYHHLNSSYCSADFAEIPAILMEYFVRDARVISKFAQHCQTGERMPTSLIMRLLKARQIFSASALQQQIVMSMVDQRLHGKHPLGKTTTEIYKDVQDRHGGIAYVQDTAPHLRHSDMFRFGAKCYSSLMARAVSSCIWHKYFSNDPFSASSGHKLYEVLASGNGELPQELGKYLLGCEITPKMLAQSLADEFNS